MSDYSTFPLTPKIELIYIFMFHMKTMKTLSFNPCILFDIFLAKVLFYWIFPHLCAIYTSIFSASNRRFLVTPAGSLSGPV